MNIANKVIRRGTYIGQLGLLTIVAIYALLAFTGNSNQSVSSQMMRDLKVQENVRSQTRSQYILVAENIHTSIIPAVVTAEQSERLESDSRENTVCRPRNLQHYCKQHE